MLECFYISTKVLTDKVGEYSSFIFVRAMDAAVSARQGGWKIFRDGTAFRISQVFWQFVSLSGGKLGYLANLDDYVYNTCQFTAQPIYTSKVTEYPINDGFFVYTGDYIDTERRLLFHRVNNGKNCDVYNLDTGAFLKTVALTITNGVYYYHYAGNGRFCAIGNNGHVIMYDYVGWSIISYSLMGISPLVATYDCNCDVIFAVNSAKQTVIYGLDDTGNTLSNPVFSPTGNKYLYSGYVLSTRLTGQTGIPVSGAWINWELLGIKGSLEKSVSITDENGYAWNYYWCPTDVSQVGSETVRVWN